MSTKDKALLVGLHVGLPGGRKTDKGVSAEVLANHNAASDAGSFSKLLLPKRALEPIRELIGSARTYHYFNSLPWDDAGKRFLPSKHFFDYQSGMKERESKFEVLKQEFLRSYPEYVEEARAKLGNLFDSEDYPEAAEIGDKFKWRLTFDPIPSGDDIRLDMQKEDLDELRQDVDRRVAQAEEQAQSDLYRRLAEPLAKMVERLADPENKFKDSLITNLQEICEMAPKLSLKDDPKLDSLLSAARNLTVHAPDTLRDDLRVRADVAKRAQEIMDQMAGIYGHVQQHQKAA